jgi:hypothetical protein
VNQTQRIDVLRPLYYVRCRSDFLRYVVLTYEIEYVLLPISKRRTKKYLGRYYWITICLTDSLLLSSLSHHLDNRRTKTIIILLSLDIPHLQTITQYTTPRCLLIASSSTLFSYVPLSIKPHLSLQCQDNRHHHQRPPDMPSHYPNYPYPCTCSLPRQRADRS